VTKPVVKIPVIIDTSEPVGHAWSFVDELFTTRRESLMTGDYSVAGLEKVLTIERKTLGDAVNTVIHNWTRFRKTLYRMAAMDHSIVLIEAGIDDILEHRYESEAEPAAVLGRLISITIDHGIPVVFAGDRATAETYAERYLIQAVRKLGGVPEC
jgi:DNA excision repair protein ERCC-4